MMRLILFALVLIIIYLFITEKRPENFDKAGLTQLNLKLQGVVIDVDEVNGFNGYGIITVRVLKSSIKYYDPRDTLDFYFCVIHDTIAEIYSHAFRYMMGDTINIDTGKG